MMQSPPQWLPAATLFRQRQYNCLWFRQYCLRRRRSLKSAIAWECYWRRFLPWSRIKIGIVASMKNSSQSISACQMSLRPGMTARTAKFCHMMILADRFIPCNFLKTLWCIFYSCSNVWLWGIPLFSKRNLICLNHSIERAYIRSS